MSQDNATPQQTLITNYVYLGLLPFFILAIGPWVIADSENTLLPYFLIYSTLVLAFLAGIIWALAIFGNIENNKRHIHAAIIFSLWPLASYLLPEVYNLGVMLIGYLLLLFWEKCFINYFYPNWYQALRHRITFIVVGCHMLMLLNIIRIQ